MEHMGQKLLKGEGVTHQPFERQRFERLLFQEDMDAVRPGIELQTDTTTHQVSRDIIAFQVQTHAAMAIHFALQMHALELLEPAIRIDRGRQGGEGGQVGKGDQGRAVATGQALMRAHKACSVAQRPP